MLGDGPAPIHPVLYLWLWLCAGDRFLTVVGSSNFGIRSVARDVELQFAIEGQDPQLRAAFVQEQQRLFQGAERVDASLWHRSDRVIVPGLRWSNGTWLHAGWRMFKPYM